MIKTITFCGNDEYNVMGCLLVEETYFIVIGTYQIKMHVYDRCSIEQNRENTFYSTWNNTNLLRDK